MAEHQVYLNESKWNDENATLPYLKTIYPGSKSPIYWGMSSEKGPLDFDGCDIWAFDTYALDQRYPGNGLYYYDTKYLRKPYAWFVIEKFDPTGKQKDIITTNYIYIWKNDAVMFERNEALKLCSANNYEIRTETNESGQIAKICTIPKNDLLNMSKTHKLPGFIQQYGQILKGDDLANWNF